MNVSVYKNLQEYIEARTARFLREGLSPEQLRKLYWDGKQSVPEIAKAKKVNPHVLYELMRKHGIQRRSLTESNYLVYRDKPQYQLRRKLTAKQKRLRTAGLMLYWAEGAKHRTRVDLANTDPNLVLVFLRFLREICGVAESRLRGSLFVYEGQDIKEIRCYWSQLTGIPEAQFTKAYVSRFRTTRTRKRVLPHGVVHIRYSDKRLLQHLLLSAQQEAGAFIFGAGTQAANEVRL